MQKDKPTKGDDNWIKLDYKGKLNGYSQTQISFGEVGYSNQFSANSILYSKNSEKQFEKYFYENLADVKSKSQPNINDKFSF